MQPRYERNAAIDNTTLSRLHAVAFSGPEVSHDWASQLSANSLGWIGAFDDDCLIGFINIISDGGVHAFVLDTAVNPHFQHQGIGKALVEEAARLAAERGCYWLHADFEDGLEAFYISACSFVPTRAGLLQLRG